MRCHSPARAFELAAAKLGDAEVLAAEFTKIPPPVEAWLPVRIAWALGALLMFATLWPMLLAMIGTILVLLGWYATSLTSSHAAIFSGGFAIIATLIVALSTLAMTAFAPAGWMRGVLKA